MKLKRRKNVETEADERLYLATWLMMDVTAALANTMEAKGLQQKHVAERLGMTAQNVSQMLEGTRNLTLRSAADLAWALDCAVRVHLQPIEEFDAETTPARARPRLMTLHEFPQQVSVRNVGQRPTARPAVAETPTGLVDIGIGDVA